MRDRLPTEVWEGINDAWLELIEWPPERITRDGVYPFCQGIRRSSYLILGLIEQTMRRDEGWQFMRLGRYLERAERSIRLVQARHLGERRGRYDPSTCTAGGRCWATRPPTRRTCRWTPPPCRPSRSPAS